ncbi:hypothetical protein VUJ46_12405 [Chryseobacterium sp. MYb264]|uniref:hypothetical protein n=1 Tax=Chryseobacterium sp. MYb264 TaxID=2745153 RepID=UPI002E122DE3|nr:hypothetical protein VUJ46_12405 [Chryseobacterium sp. MYb264]
MSKIFFIISIIFVFSCKQEQSNSFELKYIKNSNEVYLDFENKLNYDIIFLAPNTLHFSDVKKKRPTSIPDGDGFPPIIIYGIIEPRHTSKFYQQKLDSIHNSYLTEIGNANFINAQKAGDGNSVYYLKPYESTRVKYKLKIKQSPPYYEYASKYKQNYYPYEKVLKGNYPEGEYLRRFSKLNFGRAKFVLQPIIEDSLFINISEKDTE